MKTIALLIIALSATSGLAAAEPSPILTAAIFDFQTPDQDSAHEGAEVATLLGAKLSAAPNIELLERQEVDKALSEQELGMSGNVNADTAAKVGSLTGAKALITGRIFKADGKTIIVAKVFGTETSRVYAESVTLKDGESIDGGADELAPKITAIFDKHADALVAKVEEPSAHIDRLKRLVEGKKLPSVSVLITEQHVTHFILIDPAAQTEIKLILKQVGFDVVEPDKGDKKADVSITGEAISEYGMRRGNLLSCRARVEIKAVQQDNNKLLLADRQTDGGIDLAESVAAKNALQNAAAKLADRIVPALVIQ